MNSMDRTHCTCAMFKRCLYEPNPRDSMANHWKTGSCKRIADQLNWFISVFQSSRIDAWRETSCLSRSRSPCPDIINQDNKISRLIGRRNRENLCFMGEFVPSETASLQTKASNRIAISDRVSLVPFSWYPHAHASVNARLTNPWKGRLCDRRLSGSIDVGSERHTACFCIGIKSPVKLGNTNSLWSATSITTFCWRFTCMSFRSSWSSRPGGKTSVLLVHDKSDGLQILSRFLLSPEAVIPWNDHVSCFV
jgi:hypothetical protein